MSATESLPAAGNAEPAGVAPGELLAEARRALDQTPADIARQLKLSVWQVEALEAGHYQRLPSPIFVRGFIRNYAKLVKLDPNELLRTAGDRLPQTDLRPDRPHSQNIPFPVPNRPRWPALASTAVIVVGMLVVYEFYWDDAEPTASRAVAVTPAPVAPQATAEAAPPAAPPAVQGRADQPESVIAAPLAEQGTPSTSDAGAAASAEKPLKPGERKVRLAFDQESWVEIRDRDEKVIFSQLNRPGTQQLVSGTPPFTIVVGNAPGVRMTYDDQPVDLASHTRIDVARLILQ